MRSSYNQRIPHLLESDPDWTSRRREVLSREPFCRTCAELGYQTIAMTVDHIIPRARGGTSEDDNLQPLCITCHNVKTGREKHGRLDTVPITSLDGSRHGRVREIPPKNFGKSPRARFLKGKT